MIAVTGKDVSISVTCQSSKIQVKSKPNFRSVSLSKTYCLAQVHWLMEAQYCLELVASSKRYTRALLSNYEIEGWKQNSFKCYWVKKQIELSCIHHLTVHKFITLSLIYLLFMIVSEWKKGYNIKPCFVSKVGLIKRWGTNTNKTKHIPLILFSVII